MENEIDLFILDEKEKTYILQVSKTISFGDLKEIIKRKIVGNDHFSIIYKNKKYRDENEKLNLSQGDRIYIESTVNLERAVECHFHENVKLDEGDMNTVELSGILQLCLLKYIASKINDTSKIQDDEIREIIKELKEGVQMDENPQENIKNSLSQKNGNNILTYINYLKEVISEKVIDDLINLLEQDRQKDIKAFWSILSKYQDFNILFEEEFSKAIEKSYFDYSLIGVSIYQHKRRKEYLENLKKCENCEIRYLLHGTQVGLVSKILTTEFLYAKKAFYGMGVYFTDMIDYVSFYCGDFVKKDDRYYRGNWKKILQDGETISCVGTEVYYNKNKKKHIFDTSYYVKPLDHNPSYEEIKKNYKDKMVEKEGIHFVRVEPSKGQYLKSESDVENSRKEGKFIGTEYVITEMDQILPLYGLTLRRNEYFILWRDGNFKGQNEWTKYLKERKMFIYKEAKLNVFFESNTEKALELIKRKKYNKIILISSCQGEVGKKFVDLARKILGFNVVVLFYSANENNLKWIQNYPNALYTNNESFFRKYITNYNKDGLNKLKNEMNNYYNCNLNLDDECLNYPKAELAKTTTYDKLLFEEINPYLRRVMIQNKKNKTTLCMKEKNPKFIKYDGKEVEDSIWYVTMINGEMTLFSNGYYLSIDDYQNVIGSEFMKSWNYEEKDSKYLIYFQDIAFTLTISDNSVILDCGDNQNKNQLFTFLDVQE